MDHTDIATLLDSAARTATPIAQLSEMGVRLDLPGAYSLQELSIARRIARGERLVGMKMGFTSRAKMAQMGVEDMIWGRLTDAMQIRDGGSVRFADYIHPRAEPEIAFRIGRELGGTVTRAQAMAAVDAVAPAIELIDSRYRNFRFSLTDVIADNTSAAGFALGPWRAPDLALDELELALLVDGRTAQTGSGREILGDPWQSLVEAARLLGAAGLRLQPGWVVLAGAATAAEALTAGTKVAVEAGALGRAEFSVRGGSDG